MLSDIAVRGWNKKKNCIESVLGKEDFFPLGYFFKEHSIFRENCEKSFLGNMIIFEKWAHYDKN